MQSHAQTEVTVSLSEADLEQLLEEGELCEDGVTIEFFGSKRISE